MNTKTQCLDDILKAIETADSETRMVHEMTIGQWVRQGDVILLRVRDDHGHGKRLDTQQLAVGSSSGARHTAEPPAVLYEGTHGPADAILGPCVKSPESFRVSHPEHAHAVLPAGTYQTIHQMDASTRRRVAD